MATTFTAPPLWNNVGSAPSETLKTNGFQAGYKPPADIFNYQFNKYGVCIEELQNAINGEFTAEHTHPMSDIIGLQDALNGKANSTHTHAEYASKTGKSLAGQTVKPDYNNPTTTVTAGEGAEIFNDYRERTVTTDGSGISVVGNVASGEYSHAEGTITTASGNCSHAEGNGSVASGDNSHAEGNATTASGVNSHAENIGRASGFNSHAEGDGYANGSYAHAGGYGTEANDYQFVTGKYNIVKTGSSTIDQSADNSIFIVGNGAKPNLTVTRANAFRITAAGKCYGSTSFGSSGADYAEYFEWQDGNKNDEDRRGLFVTLDGDKIRLANGNDDYIVGVISANPSVIGDVQSENWHGMYKKDVFGQPLTETVEVPESTDEKTGEVIPAHTATFFVVNPDYDPDEEYKSREFRKEWACVGMLGKLIVVDDGTCEVNGYCKVANGGKATKADTGYRVMKRLDDTHIQILYR